MKDGDSNRDRFGRIEPLSLLARMQIRLGRTEEAKKAADDAVALARESGEKSPLAGAILAQALCETRSGRVEGARKAFSEAVTLFADMGSLADVAQARLDWGLAERDFGDEREARSNFAAAAATFARCGLAVRAAEAEAALKATPREEPPSGASPGQRAGDPDAG